MSETVQMNPSSLAEIARRVMEMMKTGEVKTAFRLEKLSGTVKKIVYGYEEVKKGNKTVLQRTEKVVEVDAGYMVTSPKGDSVRLSEDEVRRMNLLREPELVDDDGEVVSIAGGKK